MSGPHHRRSRRLTLPQPDDAHPAAQLARTFADAAVVVDAAGRVLAWNAAAETRFGAPALAVGQDAARLGAESHAGPATRLVLEAGAAGDAAAILAWHDPESGAFDTAVLLQRERILAQVAGPAWHEMANSLGGIASFASLLAMEGHGADDLGIDPRLIATESAKIQRLSRSLTDLARWSEHPVTIPELVSSLVELMGHMLVSVDVSVSLPPAMADPVADPGRLRQVFSWLLLDAILALGGPRQARGTMRWTVASDAHASGFIDVVVEDDRPPRAAAGRRDGGLDVVRHLVERDGGALGRGPSPAGGTRTVVRLASVKGALAPPVDQAATDAPAGPTPVTVLVCDDEAALRELLVRALRRSDIHVVAAASGQEALDLLDREAVDVVLADQTMPRMTGIELHDLACERHPTLRGRFVLMSGGSFDQPLERLAEERGLRLLAKPFPISAVAPLVREVAGR